MSAIPSTTRPAWQTTLDIVIAPVSALAALRERPTWVWAFTVSAVLAMLGTLAVGPVVAHVLGIDIATRLAASPQVTAMPAAQRESFIAQQVGIAQTISRYTFVLIPFFLALGCALQALVMLVANAIGKGSGTFKQFWALAVHGAIVGSGLASVVLAIIVLIRGAGGFASAAEISTATPGLGMFVPSTAKALAAFFGVMNVFAIWNMVLLGLGMIVIGRVSRPIAILTPILILTGTGLFPLIGALFSK